MSLPDAAWIRAHIPHQGRMCLLDRVLDWDEQHIRCQALMPTLADHPLREDGVLSSLTGIEYAAQAMAVHGALRASGGPVTGPHPGMLISARDVRCHVARLDNIAMELLVCATCHAADANLLRYTFQLRAEERVLIEGQATVMLDVHAPNVQGPGLTASIPDAWTTS